MEFSKVERLILINQFLILEKLYPEEAKYYAQHRTAFESGYKLHYPWAMEHIQDELREEQCEEVLDILEMYRSIHFSSKNCTNEKITDNSNFTFRGFDVNDHNECRLFAYVGYLVIDLDRFQELKYGRKSPDLNSHKPMLDSYRRMLKVWKKYRSNDKLTEAEIIEILQA